MFVEAAGGKFVEVKTRQEDFQIDFSALEQAITEKTKAVLLNSPNSPSGVIISEENIIRLAALLNERSAFYRHTIYLIGDEPYRDLLYHALQTYGYTCICPEGAFYLFAQTLLPDSVAFCQYARKYELLIVPGDEFGCPGYARIAYCIPTCKIELADIEDIIRHNRNVVVVVDEAYIDFGGTSAFPLLEKYDNLLIVQTFSKSRALAGLRIGYAFGSPQLIRYLNAVKNSFNSYTMNRLVQVLGAAAVRDKEYFENTNTLIIATRERMKLLFVTHPLVKAKRLYEDLRSVGIYVRYFSKPERISNYLRIAIGTDQEADYLIMQLKKY